MVQEIVGTVVAYVPKDSTTENRSCDIPVPVEDCMSEFIERSRKDHEKRRRHYQAISIHRQIMVDTVQQEMGSDPDTIVR